MTLQADLISANKEIAAKQAAMAVLLKDVDTLDADKAQERAKAIKSANDELADLGTKRDAVQADVDEIEKAKHAVKSLAKANGRQIDPTEDGDDDGAEPSEDEVLSSGIKSVRSLLAFALENTPALKSARRGFYGYRGELGELAIKTLITSADMTPQADRLTQIAQMPTETRSVTDLMLSGTTAKQKVEFFEETTFTNAAAETAEGDAKPESALDFTLRESSVRKIATWIPVTDEMLEDQPFFESYLRERLGYMVKAREELQLLQGNGSGQNLLGLYNQSGVQTVTGYGLSTLDSIYKAITEVRTDAFAEPTAMVVHPQDWFDIRTSKDANGNYLLGPATAEGPERVWGLEARVTTNAVLNTGLVGAFKPHAQIFRRSGIAIAISTENEDYFIKNKLAVRAEERLALAVFRPSAFCKIEALVAGS